MRTTTVSKQRRTSKRIFDLVVSTLLLVPALVVIAALLLPVALALRTWPLFVQSRVGHRQKAFNFVKLRTLPRSTPAYADKYSLQSIGMPRLSRWLRATHLDEIPQVVLVLLGRMSLVGPRPEMPTLASHWSPEFAAIRTSVLPGITGLWQVSEAAEGLIHESPNWDTFYVENGSFALDVWIIWRTFARTFKGRPVVQADLERWARSRVEDDNRVQSTITA
jgi:lipopolysaccharide/colanic/teichoic acid biosynthesis glycosyltransferase